MRFGLRRTPEGSTLGLHCVGLPCVPLHPCITLVVCLLLCGVHADPGPDDTREALRRAAIFFHQEVADGGGYVWRYSADLEEAEGEGKVTRGTIWVQPPGTPSVGEAYLDAWLASGEAICLQAALDAGRAMLRGQLVSGGWTNKIELRGDRRANYHYRIDPVARKSDGQQDKKRPPMNLSSLDDDKTQSSIRFLLRLNYATAGEHADIASGLQIALDSLLAAQYPNGGWAQVWEKDADQGRSANKRAGYREDGNYTHAKYYRDHYTLNDNLMSTVVQTLRLAHELTGEARYKEAALRAGGFLILSQMPDPQPGWAQQYDLYMHPAWARRFEPAAISGGESQAVMMTLLDLYEWCGDRKFLEPIPRALDYYTRSLLPSGNLARFYELGSNKPLYFTKTYRLTYSDADIPTHYSFTVRSRLPAIQQRYERLNSQPWPLAVSADSAKRPKPGQIAAIIAALDERGAWVEDGALKYWGGDAPTRRIISTRTFATNLRQLAAYTSN
jgi:PelA/Pel-15E family pectate lyase